MEQCRMVLPSIVLRPLLASDLPAAHALSQAVGWPHRLDDWRFALDLGHGLAAIAGDRVVGTVMWWCYGRVQARVGMVIVDPGAQGAGIGRQLMAVCLSQVAAPSVLLNATAAGERLYRQLGFADVCRFEQHQGVCVDAPGPRHQSRVRGVTTADMAQAIALDAAAIGAPRPAVIEALRDAGDAVLLEDGDCITGVAFCRPFGRGHLIGPLAARDGEAAEVLLSHFAARLAGKFLRIDTPPALGLASRLARYGLTKVDDVGLMCRGAAPATGPVQTFALASQALG